MNGLDNILRRIREDTQAELDALQQEAREKIRGILADGQAKADAQLAAGRQQNALAAESHKQRMISAANTEARQIVLQAKQDCLDEIFELALQQIRELPDAKFIPLLAKWVAETADFGTEELIFSPEHRETIGLQVVQQANALRPGSAFTLSDETRDTDGVILRHGNVEHNGSLSTRFQLLRERMAPEVAQALFS